MGSSEVVMFYKFKQKILHIVMSWEESQLLRFFFGFVFFFFFPKVFVIFSWVSGPLFRLGNMELTIKSFGVVP